MIAPAIAPPLPLPGGFSATRKELPSFACIKGLATNYSLVTLIALNSPIAPSLLTAATRMEYWVEGFNPPMVTLPPTSPVPDTVTPSIPPLEGGV